MPIAVQKGFFQDKYLADTRTKLAELYHLRPDIAKSEKRTILAFWEAYERLSDILGEKWNDFVDWYLTATPNETITRCLRSLKEDGVVVLTDGEQRRRQEREQDWREYWKNNKGRNNGG